MAAVRKRPTAAKIPIHLVSLGCPKNLVDSEVMLGFLTKGRYRLVQDPRAARAIIVNTCAFVHDAKQESIDTILEMARFKTEGACERLIVTGCLSQRYVKELAKALPEVDLFLGTGDYRKIAKKMDGWFGPRPGAAAVARDGVGKPLDIHSDRDPRVHTGATYTGFLKVSEGCNRHCSFCIIPALRGPVRSRGIASLVREATRMARAGVRELNLVAQDLTEYGMDLRKKGQKSQRLEKLLPALCKVRGLEWLRLHYVYPDDFSDELVELIAREPRIVKYLDLPLQHTNDRILKLMNRKLRKERIFRLVDRLRERVPGLVLRASIIVGFPGETEAEFRELCDDLHRLQLDRVGVFRYSAEEGTPAADLPGQLGEAVKHRRERTLMRRLERESLARQKRAVGRITPVMIEGLSPESDLLIQGRMPTQAPEIDGHVLINDTGRLALEALKPGQLVLAEITEALPHDLIGRVVGVCRTAK
jgi:ribosomal protein S12 methylthiotransferase